MNKIYSKIVGCGFRRYFCKNGKTTPDVIRTNNHKLFTQAYEYEKKVSRSHGRGAYFILADSPPAIIEGNKVVGVYPIEHR